MAPMKVFVWWDKVLRPLAGLVSGLLLLPLPFSLCFASAKIILDPGHGGQDRGAVFNDTKESDLTLQISTRLRNLLRQRGFDVIMTRQTDRHVSLAERARIAREYQGHLFLSIHTNSSGDIKAHGMEVYFENQLPADEESMFLANKENNDLKQKEETGWPLRPIAEADHLSGDLLNIVQDLQRNFRIQTSSRFALQLAEKWRGRKRPTENTVRQAPFYVLKNVNMTSALIEVGFISNVSEAEQLKSASYQNEIVLGILNGIEGFTQKK